jgi:hypothetical protein
MNVQVQFGEPRDITPWVLDGVIVRFPFLVTKSGQGARKDITTEHWIDVGISGTLYSFWGFRRFHDPRIPDAAIKTLFQFGKEEVKRKLEEGTLTDHQELRLYTSSQPSANPYDVARIESPVGSIMVVRVPKPADESAESATADTAYPPAPKVFISYSWDSDQHREWTRELAERLRGDGSNVTLDQWHLAPGDQMAEFMERAVRENDLVLIICTPRYKQKSDERSGGVGYEGDIMTAEVLSTRNHRKFVPILRMGPWSDAAPSWLRGKLYVDLSGSSYSEDQYHDLLATIHNQRPSPPPVGAPTSLRASRGGRSASAPSSDRSEPIAIEGIVVDEVTLPRNDGTRGSALYAISFKLTRRPLQVWTDAFIAAWNHPSRFTTMHRPSIARVSGDKIILDGTTIEEVERYHRDTLKLAVEAANNAERRRTEEESRRRQAEHHQSEQHRAHLEDAAGRIRFD